ncbi:MAG: DUF3016 domain-containing protein [Burkholderiales bacterium]|nr:DUF3016 domain-containing protein [Burkholderiales bacterium]
MKKFIWGLLAAGLLGPAAQAAEVKVSWHEPEKFTDIRPNGYETRDAFQQRVFKEFDQMFAAQAQRLADGYLLEVTVTDLDLAGEVRPLFARTLNDIRVVKELYWPRMSFRYTLKDPQGKQLAAGKEDLKDMNFMMRAGVTPGYTSFGYEEHMLRDWFHKKERDKVFPLK